MVINQTSVSATDGHCPKSRTGKSHYPWPWLNPLVGGRGFCLLSKLCRFFTTPQTIFVLYHNRKTHTHEIDSKCTFFSAVRIDLWTPRWNFTKIHTLITFQVPYYRDYWSKSSNHILSWVSYDFCVVSQAFSWNDVTHDPDRTCCLVSHHLQHSCNLCSIYRSNLNPKP